MLVDKGDRLEVLLGDRTLDVPARIRPALEEVRGRVELRPRDLPLDEQSRLVLARRLVREGLLRVVPHDVHCDGRVSFRCATRVRRAPSRWPGRPRRCAPSCSSSTPGRGVRRHSGTRGCPPASAPSCASAPRHPDQGAADPATDKALRTHAGVRVFAAYTHHAEPWLETTVLDDLQGVHDLDLEALAAGRSLGLTPHSEPVLAVCTHGRHDKCCAERGRPVAAGLAKAFPDQTWEASHIGGDRFAANLLVLPHGLYFGRLEADTARGVARLLAAGELDLDHLRGRSGLATPLQAAEAALRRYVDERRLSAVRFVSREVSDGDDRRGVRRLRSPLRRHGDQHPRRRPAEAHLPRAARESRHAPHGPRDPGALT